MPNANAPVSATSNSSIMAPFKCTGDAHCSEIGFLENSRILNRIPEESYNRIVRRVSAYFDVPICLISLIDAENQWFKAKVGVDLDTFPREASFCEAALEQSDVYIVTDASQSIRFRDHPAVAGAPEIRFYAGVPLLFEGRNKVGTLCILDTKPRTLDANQIDALKDYASLVVDELHLRLRAVKVEAQLDRYYHNLNESIAAEKDRADFLAMVTHEIRAPLNAILGMVTLLSLEGEQAQKPFSPIDLRTSTEHLVRLINDVLDLAKLEATGFPFVLAPFSLRLEMESIVEIVRPQAEAKGLSLKLSLSESIPELIVGDRTRLSQVLLNLLNNAIKFTVAGGVHVQATATHLEQCVEIAFSVSDSGVGLPETAKDQLFKCFSQLHLSRDDDQQGTGLGLAISRKLVEAMGGTIAVSSKPGVGTRFSFCLRFNVVSATPMSPATHTASLRVLVVDDDVISSKVFCALLKHMGHAVEFALNGGEALARLSSTPFDAAFLDINVPELDGYAIAQQYLEGKSPDDVATLIAVSGADPADGDARLALFDDYLVKPVSMDTLQASIAKLMQGRRGFKTIKGG